MNSDCDASAANAPTWSLLLDSLSPTRLGWRSHCSGLRSGIDRCVRSHSDCYRWRTHFEAACRHKARSHHCPCQEHRREQAYDGEQTRVAWTLGADSGRHFIPAHDPHFLTSFEAHLRLQQPFNSDRSADSTENHRALTNSHHDDTKGSRFAISHQNPLPVLIEIKTSSYGPPRGRLTLPLPPDDGMLCT